MMLLIKYLIVLVIGVVIQISAQKLAKQKIQSYQSCKTDRDCKINSFCFGNDDNVSGKCKCLDGYELIRNTTFYECLAGAKLADACDKDIQCQVTAGPLALCNQYKICQCNTESQSWSGICYAAVKIGDICMSDQNCFMVDGSQNGTLAFCTDGRCTCRTDQQPSQDRTRCLSSRKLGEPCLSDEECAATPNSRCLEACRCATEYTLSRDDNTCVKAATKFGEQCDFDGQCSKFLSESLCNNGQCGCLAGFHDYGNRCVATRKKGDRCDEDAQCLSERKLYENVKCQDGTCRCLFGDKGGACILERDVDNSPATKLTMTVSVVCFNSLFIFSIFKMLSVM